MSNTPYRTMEVKDNKPTFTFVERLFLDGKWYKKFLGHIILIGKPALWWCAFILVPIAFIGISSGLWWLISTATDYIIAHGYLSKTQLLVITFGGMFVIIIFTKLYDFIKSLIEDNNERMSRRIKDKLTSISNDDNPGY